MGKEAVMKYTKQERNWVMYDVGNSALVLFNTSVVPIYFDAINTGPPLRSS